MHLVLYQPDIPQNAGSLARFAACMAMPIHLIEPAGFRTDDRALRRAGMDYLQSVEWVRHVDFDAFENWRREQGARLILASTKGETGLWDMKFRESDCIMLGRESSGVPDHVHEIADRRVVIPMQNQMRSLNVAMAGAMVVGEAVRQIQSGN